MSALGGRIQRSRQQARLPGHGTALASAGTRLRICGAPFELHRAIQQAQIREARIVSAPTRQFAPVFKYAALLLLLSSPAIAEAHLYYTFSQWERLKDDDRAAYIADFIDTLATRAATQPAQRAARHYSECIMRTQLTARQLADFLREYARARPELQRGSVQRAMNDYLNALCGRPLD